MLLAMLLACGPKETPAHLRIDTVEEEAVQIDVVDDASALTLLLQRDPLARQAVPPPDPVWRDIPAARALEEWASLERQPESMPTDWQSLAGRWPDTIVVGLARGSALGRLEVLLAGESDRSLSVSTVAWLGPLRTDELLHPRAPAAWLSEDPDEARQAALAIMERSVLLGWLDGPSVPLSPVSAVLDPALQGRLVESPAGVLIRNRAAGATDESASDRGRDALSRATTAALWEVSADADKEQAAWRRELVRLREEHGVQDPIGSLLATARTDLQRDAGRDESAGLGIVAATAERLRSSCPDRPCGGLDRSQTLAAAERWGELPTRLARTWRLISLKQAVDAFESSGDHPTFKRHAPLLADALLGTGAASMDLGVLRVQTATPGTFLALGRAAGRDGITDAEGAERALRDHLAALSSSVLELPLDDQDQRFVERIARRARD